MPRRFWAPTERAELCDLLDEMGPDRPVLRPGWTTGDLAAHLVVREHSPAAAAGLVAAGRAPVRAAALLRVRRRPFPEVVGLIRGGNGLLPRDGRWAEALHLLEFAVHRQDILRAAPDRAAAPPGESDPDRDAALFDQLHRRAARLGREVPAGAGLLLRSRGHGSIGVRRGPSVVVVDGCPVDLALWLFGRVAAARVTVTQLGEGDVRAGVEEALSR